MFEIHVGDCREVMRTMGDQSVQCCVTSPPYWGLRDYGRDGQLGLEQTPDQYVDCMVDVFREVRRVLRDDGTLWLNLGDSYASKTKGSGGPSDKQISNSGSRFVTGSKFGFGSLPLKQKDLVGVPWRVAFALQEDGWYLRQDIIWHKPNPMPESVRDRCTKAHEYVFLMSKNSRYFFDANSIAEKAINAGKTVKKINPLTAKNAAKGRFGLTAVGFTEHDTAIKDRRNRRSVWSIPTRPYRGAHFATMPPALVEPCILAGSREGDTILDPFTGSGTTGAVAISLGRLFVGAELNDEYAAMAQNRIGAALEDRKKMLLMKESQMMFREETT